MPGVLDELVDMLTVEELCDLGRKRCLGGPYIVNIDILRGPIVSINFYAYTELGCTYLTVYPQCRGKEEEEGHFGYIFDMGFPIPEFAETVKDDEHQAQLVEKIMGRLVWE